MNKPLLSPLSVTFVVLICLGLSACAAPATPTALPASPTALRPTTQVPSALPPANTATLPATATLPPAATRTPTIVPSATPAPLRSDVRLVGLYWARNYDLQFSFEVPGASKSAFELKIEHRVYPCETLAKSPDMLYCTGPGLNAGKITPIELRQKDTQTVIFQKDVSIPLP